MKKYLFVVLTTIVCTLAISSVPVTTLYKNYIKTSEELLWNLEEMCELNDIPWGDTICETDAWADYCESREALGLGYLEHHSKRR